MFCEFDALRHVLVVNELEHYRRFRRVGVVARIMLLVVFLYCDYRVLTLCRRQFLVGTPHAHGVRFHASGYSSCRQCVGMNGYEDIRMIAVGYLRTPVQGHEDILRSGIYHLHVLTVSLDILSESECGIEVYVFLFHERADGSCVMSAVSGINDEHEFPVVSHGSGRQHHQAQYADYMFQSVGHVFFS